MRKIFLLLFAVLLVGCTSASFEVINGIPEEYETVFVVLDSSKTTINSTGFFTSGSGTYFYNYGDSFVLDSLNNRNIVIKDLTKKGYKYTSDLEKADIVLLAGYTSNEFRSKVSISLLDSKTEELLFTTSGMYGMGLGIDSDITHALKNALKGIPARMSVETVTTVEE